VLFQYETSLIHITNQFISKASVVLQQWENLTMTFT